MISHLVVAFVKAVFMSSDILIHWCMVLRTQYMFYVLQIGFLSDRSATLLVLLHWKWPCYNLPKLFFCKPLLNISWILLDIINCSI